MLMRRLALASLLASLTLIRLPAQTTQMGIDEIRPGMVGIGRTVFDGTRVEEFKANILGVLENVIGTHRNLILAKLEGSPLERTGVIAGMSGSPVYVDGKLIGAVSYSLGQFSKEAIAVRKNMARLRELRLAKEAATIREQIAIGNDPKAKSTKRSK